MSVNIRVRDGIAPAGGSGGVNEGGLRGAITDIIESLGGIVDLAGGQLLAHQAASPAMTVVIDAGIGYVPNTSFSATDFTSAKFWEAVVAGTTGSRTLSIDANSSGSTRYDLVGILLVPATSPDKYGSNIASLSVVKGTPGAGVPAIPSYYLPLGQVQVVNGASSITNDKITDVRTQVTVNSNYCQKRVTAITSSATPTPNVDTTDEYQITALAADATIGAPTGTYRNGRPLIMRIKDNGTARGLTWDSIYRGVGLVLPSTTILGKTLYIGMLYNAADNKFDVISAPQEF